MDCCDRFSQTNAEEHINEFLRQVHSLKGAAQACAETLCSEICHSLETHFNHIGPKGEPWSEQQIHEAFQFLYLIQETTEPQNNTDTANKLEKLNKKYATTTSGQQQTNEGGALPNRPLNLQPKLSLKPERTWVACIQIDSVSYKFAQKAFANRDLEVASVENLRHFINIYSELGDPLFLLVGQSFYEQAPETQWIHKIEKSLKIFKLPTILLGNSESFQNCHHKNLPHGILVKTPRLKADLEYIVERALPRNLGPKPCPKATCLLVEDNKINQKVGQKVLKKLGYHIDIAADGLIALEQCSSQNYDIILMDLEMPNMGGLECSSELRKRGIQTPIFAMTAHTNPKVMDICKACGMNDGMSKPLKLENLLKLLHQFSCLLPKEDA
jgi:CheY-like chemotaxis protein/HPt (histidine-containing phosphotransfer) domain-containing protein